MITKTTETRLEERLRILESVNFEETDMNKEGRQTVVFIRKDLDFVVKLPWSSIQCADVEFSYALAIEHLSMIIPETVILKNRTLRIKNRAKKFPLIILQDKVSPFSFTDLESVRQYAGLHISVLNAGLYCADLKMRNSGRLNSAALLYDLGHVSTEINDFLKLYIGYNLYFEAFHLAKKPSEFIQTYALILGIDFNSSVNLVPDLTDLQNTVKVLPKFVDLRRDLTDYKRLQAEFQRDSFHGAEIQNAVIRAKYIAQFLNAANQLISNHYRRN